MASNPGLLPDLSKLRLAPSSASGLLMLENPGDAESYPVWEVRGPGNTFKAISPTGERLVWLGTLTEDEELTIDTQLGTVVDQAGENRYEDLDEAPRMWSIPPGDWEAEVSLEDTSTGRWVAAGTSVTNRCINPKATSTTGFQANSGGVLSAPEGHLRVTGKEGASESGFYIGSGTGNIDRMSVLNVAPGMRRAFRVLVRNPLSYGIEVQPTVWGGYATGTTIGFNPTVPGAVVPIPAGEQRLVQGISMQPDEPYFNGNALNAAAFHLNVLVPVSDTEKRPLAPGEFAEFSDIAVFVGDDAPGSTPVPYFNGDSSSGANGIFAWTGTANASQSTRTTAQLVGASRIAVSWRPRRHFVI